MKDTDYFTIFSTHQGLLGALYISAMPNFSSARVTNEQPIYTCKTIAEPLPSDTATIITFFTETS